MKLFIAILIFCFFSKSDFSKLQSPKSVLPVSIQQLLYFELFRNTRDTNKAVIERLLAAAHGLPRDPNWQHHLDNELERTNAWERELHSQFVSQHGKDKIGEFRWSLDSYRSAIEKISPELLDNYIARPHKLVSFRIPLELLIREGFYLDGIDTKSIFLLKLMESVFIIFLFILYQKMFPHWKLKLENGRIKVKLFKMKLENMSAILLHQGA